MKSFLFFLCLIISSLVFSQSAKKLNKQLLAEFALEQQKQDSALAIFTETKREFDSISILTTQKIDLLADKERIARSPYLELFELTNLLKQLGTDPNTLIPIDSKITDLPDYRRSFLPIKELVKRDVTFEKVSSRLYLEMFKRKEQNKMLTEKLNEYRIHTVSNGDKHRELEGINKKLNAFSPRVDSLIDLYQRLGEQLIVQKSKLENKLYELQANYIQKGPKGFSEAYQRIFLDGSPQNQEATPYVGHIIRQEGAQDVFPIDKPDSGSIKSNPVVPTFYEFVDEPAQFPGGNSAMLKYLGENIHYPEIASELGISASKLFVRFRVSDQGVISDIKVIKGVANCPECDAEYIRVIKAMPNWIPGKIDGKAVNSVLSLPIQIHLN